MCIKGPTFTQNGPYLQPGKKTAPRRPFFGQRSCRRRRVERRRGPARWAPGTESSALRARADKGRLEIAGEPSCVHQRRPLHSPPELAPQRGEALEIRREACGDLDEAVLIRGYELRQTEVLGLGEASPPHHRGADEGDNRDPHPERVEARRVPV